MDKLLLLRQMIKKPIIISSGYRCPKHNEEVGGARYSYHMTGCATDIYSLEVKKDALLMYIHNLDFKGVGTYKDKNVIHVDSREGEKARW